MNTDRQTATVAARELHIGDTINGARITSVNTNTTPGVVYVNADNGTDDGRQMVFNHGDPARIERVADSYATSGCHCGDDIHDCR